MTDSNIIISTNTVQVLRLALARRALVSQLNELLGDRRIFLRES